MIGRPGVRLVLGLGGPRFLRSCLQRKCDSPSQSAETSMFPQAYGKTCYFTAGKELVCFFFRGIEKIITIFISIAVATATTNAALTSSAASFKEGLAQAYKQKSFKLGFVMFAQTQIPVYTLE